MIEELKNLETQAREQLLSVTDAAVLQELRFKFLGRKGFFASISARISEVAPEERRQAGQEINRVKQSLEELFSQKEKSLDLCTSVTFKKFDMTMPGTFKSHGTLHALTQVVLDITRIFERLGF